MKKKYLILLILLIIFFSCKKTEKKDIALQQKADNIYENQSYGVVTEDRLRLRSFNDLRAKTLRYLNKGDIVLILERDQYRTKIGELEDYWYNVEYQGINGWVFGYYLDIYSSYEEAKSSSKKYNQQENTQGESLIQDLVKNNLLFLSNGKLYKNTSGRADDSKEQLIDTQLYITYYNYSKIIKKIFYIAKKNEQEINGNLYLFDHQKKESILIKRSIHFIEIDDENGLMITITYMEEKKSNFWVVSIINLKEQYTTKEITKIEDTKNIYKTTKDPFSKTVIREKGSLCYVKSSEKGSMIYFKPPQETLYYLISSYNGKYIQIEKQFEQYFEIDSSRYLTVKSKFDEKINRAKYVISVYDKFASTEKELVESELYPINFTISDDPNLIALSMVDVNKEVLGFYQTFIYGLYIPNSTFIQLTTDATSYQPRWILLSDKL